MIWDSIALIIAINLLYNNFEMTIVSFFYLGNKNLEQIELIIIFIEAANLAKQATSITKDLAIMVRKKRP